MVRKTFGMLAVTALMLSTSCKNENASDKINPENVAKAEQKVLLRENCQKLNSTKQNTISAPLKKVRM